MAKPGTEMLIIILESVKGLNGLQKDGKKTRISRRKNEGKINTMERKRLRRIENL